MPQDIHPTAIVAPTARLGEGVAIGPYCIVGPMVQLGDRTKLHPHAIVEGDTWLGTDCEVFPYAVLGTTPQDKKLRAGDVGGRLRIGNHNRIREHTTIHGGTSFGGGQTVIGDHNMLLVGCHIGHDAIVGNHVVFTNGAMVSNDAPPFSMVQGDRAKLVGVNVVGLQRNQYTAEQKSQIKRVFRLLFWRNGTLQQRLEAVRNTPLANEPACQKIVDFVAKSQRGVCSPRGGRRVEAGDSKDSASHAAADRRPGDENAQDR